MIFIMMPMLVINSIPIKISTVIIMRSFVSLIIVSPITGQSLNNGIIIILRVGFLTWITQPLDFLYWNLPVSYTQIYIHCLNHSRANGLCRSYSRGRLFKPDLKALCTHCVVPCPYKLLTFARVVYHGM